MDLQNTNLASIKYIIVALLLLHADLHPLAATHVSMAQGQRHNVDQFGCEWGPTTGEYQEQGFDDFAGFDLRFFYAPPFDFAPCAQGTNNQVFPPPTTLSGVLSSDL